MSGDGWEACPHCGEEYSVGDHPCLAAAWARCLELEQRLRAVLEAQWARADAEDRERVEERAAWRLAADAAEGWRASYEAQKRNALAYLADAEALAAKLTLAEAEGARLRDMFDVTRHGVLRSMGVEDMGHGWAWIKATLAEAAAARGTPEDRVLAAHAAHFLDDLGHHMEAGAVRALLR